MKTTGLWHAVLVALWAVRVPAESIQEQGRVLVEDSQQQQQQQQQQQSGASELPPDFLTEDSVVLITGAAGFIGSSLALALHRTYQPRKIICVDRMNPHPQSQEDLALLEFQRQRAFSVLQALGSVGEFWRVDVRPSIPEYFDLGEVPVLDHIFRENPDITHVVHLADPSAHPQSPLQQVIPREKDSPKAGMTEALLEQLVKIQRETPERSIPHFVFASSSDVYPHADSTDSAQEPLVESQPVTTPRSFRGTSKLMDEMLCKLYHDMHGIFAVGLRFFTVYGPWSVPGTPLFEMAERAVSGNADLLKEAESLFRKSDLNSIHDYVYIDDAINAIMASMQFRPQDSEKPHPVIFNVASGTGSSIHDIVDLMQEYFPMKEGSDDKNRIQNASRREQSKPTVNVAIGSLERATTHLGYKPQNSLRDGVVQLLAWHFDRAFPYGGRMGELDEKSAFIASKGIVSCHPYDQECLKEIPVFPCSSECSHEGQCTSSYYDPIVAWTQDLTSQCKTVLYTVDFDESLESIPSAHTKLHPNSEPFVDGDCNLAFVSDASKLVQALSRRNKLTSFIFGSNQLLRHGQWILVPLPIPALASGENDILRLLPKLSPGLFFGLETKRAIYIDPNLLVDSIPKLLYEASTQPYKKGVEGATAMLIGRGVPNNSFFATTGQSDIFDAPGTEQVLPAVSTAVQNAAYRMIRIAVKDQLFGDGNFMDLLDSRWLVHTLQSDDSRLFRCDVFGEVVQWKVDSDRSALEFILGLHDMWSRVLSKQTLGVDAWWVGDDVKTVQEGAKLNSSPKQYNSKHRRLDDAGDVDDGDDVGDDGDLDDMEDTDEEDLPRGPNILGGSTGDDDDDDNDGVDADTDKDTNDGGAEQQPGEGPMEGVFGGEAKDEDKEIHAADNQNRGDSSELDGDDDDDALGDANAGFPHEEYDGEGSSPLLRDYSAYDAWMGVLSATSKMYFVRIVPSSEVGVVSVEEHSDRI